MGRLGQKKRRQHPLYFGAAIPAASTILETQITDGALLARLADTETITGTWTFDNDPAAPFAVTAGSAVVTNLDADKLDGQEGSYYQDASNLNAGTLADARVAASNVTQHEASLTILETQITDGAVLARVGGNETITGDWTFNGTTGVDIATGKVLTVNSTQVVKARITGWATATGTAARTTYATFAGQTITNPPTQAEVQAIDDHVVILSQRLKALIDDLHATAGHGLIGT